MLRDLRTAMSSRRFVRLGDAAMSPSMATTNVFSRKRGTY